MNTPASKQLLRNEMRTMLRKIPAEVKNNASQSIIQNIMALPAYTQCTVIFGFIPMQSEPEISPLYDTALSQGKKVAFPQCLPNGEMTFHLVNLDWRKHVVKSLYGNLEPDAEIFTPFSASTREPSLILVPGLAFSPQGQRLGRSMGFFDRFLAHKGLHLFSVGVCFASQIQPDIPTESHDSTLDSVVTESMTY